MSVIFLFVLLVVKKIVMHNGKRLFICHAATVTCFIFLMGISLPSPPLPPHTVSRSSVPGVRKQAGCDTSLLRHATSYLQEFPVGRQVEASASPTGLPRLLLLLGRRPKGTEVTKTLAILGVRMPLLAGWLAPRPPPSSRHEGFLAGGSN